MITRLFSNNDKVFRIAGKYPSGQCHNLSIFKYGNGWMADLGFICGPCVYFSKQNMKKLHCWIGKQLEQASK